jgi:hypothetical protein
VATKATVVILRQVLHSRAVWKFLDSRVDGPDSASPFATDASTDVGGEFEVSDTTSDFSSSPFTAIMALFSLCWSAPGFSMAGSSLPVSLRC